MNSHIDSLRSQAMKDPGEEAQPLGKLLHLRLTAEEPEPIPTEPARPSPIVSLVVFLGALVAVAVLLTWILT